MFFVLRCFGDKRDPRSGQTYSKQNRATTASSQKHGIAAVQGACPITAGRSESAPSLEVAVKASQPEAAEPDQNGHAGSGGVVQVMGDDEGDRQAVDGSFPRRISLGSPLLLFNSHSVATHQSLTLKLQGAARPGSSAPAVDNWVALGSIADGHATEDSAERTTAGSSLLQQRHRVSRNDAPAAQAASASASGRPAAAPTSQPDSQAQTQQADPQLPSPSTLPASSQPTASSRTGQQPHIQARDARTPTAVGVPLENPPTSPSRWSRGSSSNQPVSLVPGTARQKAGGAPGACSPATCHSMPLPIPRPLPLEELAALVSNLARVRGHWLEALHTVVTLAAELLGADSLSVHLLSDSGATHAALACHGDAGGAIRLGMPLPAMAVPGANPTALQRLYQTGEPQRGSVWGGMAALQNAPQLSTAHSAPVPAYASPAASPDLVQQHSCKAPMLSHGAGRGFNPHRHDSCGHLTDRNFQQEQYQQSLQRQHQHLHRQHSQHHCQHPHQMQQQQQHPPAAGALPPDWHSMRVQGGMTDFVAVPLLRGDSIIGALQVVDNCTPPEDITGAVPTSRRCRGVAELSVVASFIGTLLIDREVLCLMGAVEAIMSAQDVDGLVRALARHVGLFCCMRKHITPGVRVALIRGDAAALALFLDEGATAAAAAAAAGNLAIGAAAGSTTPVGVLSTAISRHSTAYNLLHAASITGGGGGPPSGACTPDPRHLRSPGPSTSGMAAGLGLPAMGRSSQLPPGGVVGGGSASARCVIPVYSPSAGTRDPSSILDTEHLLPAIGGVTSPAGLRTAAAASSSTLLQPAISKDAAAILHVHGNTSMSGLGGGGDGLSGVSMSNGGELWPWFGSTTGRAKGAGGDGDDYKGRITPRASVAASTAAVAAAAEDTVDAIMARCAALAGLPSALSCECASMLVTCERDYTSMVDDLPAPPGGGMACAAGGTDAPGPHVIHACSRTTGQDAADARMEHVKSATAEPSLGHGLSASVVAAAALSGGMFLEGTHAGAEVTVGLQNPDMADAASAAAAARGAAAAVAASASASGHVLLPSALLSVPVPSSTVPAIAQTRMGAASCGLYGRALAMAGEDSVAPGEGRGMGQVQGHAMLTRGTVLAEALAAGTGMYIADVAIYMQDGRNKSRDVFLAPSGRGGPAQPTNSIAVTTISHAGVPLVGIYITYGTPLPASLLNALTSKVQAFGAMLGPLLHEQLTSGDSELADEWRYLLGEVLDPQAIQSAADEQRSRRSSAAPYINQQLQQQQQQHAAQMPPPLTAPPSPLQILTGVAATKSQRREALSRGGGGVGGGSAVVSSAADAAETPTARAAAGKARLPSVTGNFPYTSQQSSSVHRGGDSLVGACSGIAALPSLLRRSQTADTGALVTSSTVTSRAYPSADGVSKVAASRSRSRSLLNTSGYGSIRASVIAEAATRVVAACASEPCAGSANDSSTSASVAEAEELRMRWSAALPLSHPSAGSGSATTTTATAAASGSASSAVHQDRSSINRMPLTPPPSPMLSAGLSAATVPEVACSPAGSVLQGRAPGRKPPAATASGPLSLPPLHTSLQQTQSQQQQRHRNPLPSSLHSPSHQQQQRQSIASRPRLNCSFRIPATSGRQQQVSPSSVAASAATTTTTTVASPPSVVAATASSATGSPASKLKKAASEGVPFGAVAQALFLRGGSLAGRNLDGGTLHFVDSRGGQYGSSNVSSGAALVSRSTSGALGVVITAPPSASAPPPPHSDAASTSDGLLTGIPGNPANVAARVSGDLSAFSGTAWRAAAATVEAGDGGCNGACRSIAGVADVAPTTATAAECTGQSSGRAGVHVRPAHILLPADPCLKVAETSPSGQAAGSEQDRLLQHLFDDRRSPLLPQPTLPSPQRQLRNPPLNPFATECPLSPPCGLELQPHLQPSRAAAGTLASNGSGGGCGSGSGADLSPPSLRAAATLPPPSAEALAAYRLHRSPSVMSGSPAVATAGVVSTSQLELAGDTKVLLPAYLAAANSVGSLGGSAATNRASMAAAAPVLATGNSGAGAGASGHNMDVELSMQAWHLSTGTSSRTALASAAHGSRHSPRGGHCAPDSLCTSKRAPGFHDVMSPGPIRQAKPQPYPAVPSPLSPGRFYHGGGGGGAATGAGTAPPFSVRRCSAGGMAPASPQPPPQPPRIGAGLSRLTTVGTAAGVPGSGGGASAGGCVPGPSPLSEAAARTPNVPGCSAAAVGLAAAAGGPPGPLGPLLAKMPSPIVQRLRSTIRRNISFNITPDSGVQGTGKVAPLMANLQDKLRSLQAEQVLARLHSKDASGADELSGLTILEPLGSGGFGTVFRGIFNGIEVAVKVLCERGSGGRSEAATMREAFELAVMTTISHPHIVQVLSAFTDVILATKPNLAGGPNSTTTVVLPRTPVTEELGEPTVVIAMEYCDAGSLADAVSAGRFRERVPGGYGALQPCMPAIYATLLEIALALRHMHAMLLVHCDLKPANILLKSNMRDPRGFSAKLSDFGLVKMVVEDGTGGGGAVIGRDARTGTVTHMAPELIRATEASKMDASVDVYAFGVLMWEMLSTAPVYLGMRSEDIRRGVADGELRPEFPPWSDEKYRALAEACLSTDPRARPTAAELVARLRTLLAESGALQDTIMRRPCKSSAFPTGKDILPGGGGGGGAAAGREAAGFPGHSTAAAAGAMLGISPTGFCRPSRLMPAQPQVPPQYPLAAAEAHNRRGRSRSYSGLNDSSTFPLHIL